MRNLAYVSIVIVCTIYSTLGVYVFTVSCWEAGRRRAEKKFEKRTAHRELRATSRHVAMVRRPRLYDWAKHHGSDAL